MTRSAVRRSAAILTVGAVSALMIGAVALPASAVTPAPGSQTFSTAGDFDFAVPAGISSLTVTVSGSAGAAPSFAITNDPTAVGGAGGVATVTLPISYAGSTLVVGVGGEGEGSYVQDEFALLAVAGGGGQGGYAAYLQFPDQILATYPGGDGGSPAAFGITDGGNGTAFGGHAANGLGGSAVAGAGGTGDYPGTAGGASTTVTPTGSTLAAGGTGGSLAVDELTHNGGVGGTGYTGGGGAIQLEVPAGDVPIDLVAAGGGGSGFLAAGLTAVAGTPNTGAGSVTFNWTFPAVADVLPATGSDVGTDALAAGSLALLLLVAGAGIMLAGRRNEAGN